jgi:hypothetical protein
MNPDFVFWLALGTKMVVSAVFVIAATVTAERAGAAIGALVATLPISAGPAYVFLALDHDAAFISASALWSLVINAATVVYAAVYVLLARNRRLVVSLPVALAIWIALAVILHAFAWTTLGALVLNFVAFPLCFLAVRPYRIAHMPQVDLRWTDLAFRALLVALLVAAVVTLSFQIGPAATGILAAFPIVFTSIMLVLNLRVGDRAAAAVLANAVIGLAGFGTAALTLHLAALVFGTAAALVLALAVSIGWNLAVHLARQRGIPL